MNPHAEDWARQGYLPIWIIARKIGRDIPPREAMLEPTAHCITGGQVGDKLYPRGIAFTYKDEIDPLIMLHEIAHTKLGHKATENSEQWFKEEIEAIVWAFSRHSNCRQFKNELYQQIFMSKIDCEISKHKAFRIATSTLLARINSRAVV